MLRMVPFAAAPLLPAALLFAACFWGAPWAVAGIVAITGLSFVLDRIAVTRPVQDATGHRISETLGIVHFALLGAAVWAMGGTLPSVDKVLIVIGSGLYFGQISNSNAHELIHRANRWAFRLGAANYITLLFGHHTSAHRLVHHVHAATPHDPATAPMGMGFWAYVPRTWWGSFRAGLHAERRRHGGVRLPVPYVIYILGALVTLGISVLLAGWKGALGLCVIALYAQVQLMLSDYVQHYGLTRAVRAPDGRQAQAARGGYEPMGPQHSWNAPHWYSSAMMLNAPHHSAHHTAPARAFPQLDHDPAPYPRCRNPCR